MSKATKHNLTPKGEKRSPPTRPESAFEKVDRILFKDAKPMNEGDMEKVIEKIGDQMFPSSSSKRT